MKFNRKRYATKRRSSGGQAILEYIIIVALVAVAALTVIGLFGDRIRQMFSSVITTLGGEKPSNIENDSGKTILQDMQGDEIDF